MAVAVSPLAIVHWLFGESVDNKISWHEVHPGYSNNEVELYYWNNKVQFDYSGSNAKVSLSHSELDRVLVEVQSTFIVWLLKFTFFICHPEASVVRRRPLEVLGPNGEVQIYYSNNKKQICLKPNRQASFHSNQKWFKITLSNISRENLEN